MLMRNLIGISVGDLGSNLENNIPAFNPITGKCQLCIREKFTIVLKPELATLNLRHEIFSSCRHKDGKLLSKPP